MGNRLIFLYHQFPLYDGGTEKGRSAGAMVVPVKVCRKASAGKSTLLFSRYDDEARPSGQAK